MKGAVFQTSAMMIAICEYLLSPSQRIGVFERPSTLLATPSVLKMSFHMTAETMVGMAHGTRMDARTRPRPRKALAMMSAIATPRIVSRTTQTTVKSEVLMKALINRSRDP